jgi:ABC-type sugar transport system permease subunit
MVVYLAAIRAIPREYYEHGELEGIGRLSRLRRITWPLLWPQTLALTVLTTIGTLRVFDLVWIMTAGGPGHATETVATYVYSTAFRSQDPGYAQAMATILIVLIVVLAAIEYRLLGPRAEAVTT